MSSIIIFFIVLAVLIFIHELGHFLSAKAVGARVEEFGLGFPPRLFSFKLGETVYSLNLIFFGGFVKILGENEEEENHDLIVEDSLASKSLWQQALVIVSGVSFNWLLAWLILFISFMAIGLPTASVVLGNNVGQVVINDIISYSPADQAGLKEGDIITGVSINEEELIGQDLSISSFIDFTTTKGEAGEFLISFLRNGEEDEVFLSVRNIDGYQKPLMGLIFDSGVEKLGLFPALKESFVLAISLTVAVIMALVSLVGRLFIGDMAITEAVYGPIGIVGIVGEASQLGIFNLLFLMAVISINLAIINLLPFPALDGGRLLFIGIEGLWGRALPRRIVNLVNWFGLILLMIIMILVTYGDIGRIFGNS